MTEQPAITVDVHTEHSDKTGGDSAWVRYRWMCSECGGSGLAETSTAARAEGDKHIADRHETETP